MTSEINIQKAKFEFEFEFIFHIPLINTIRSVVHIIVITKLNTLRITNFKTIIVKYDGTNLKAKLVIEVGPFGSLCVAR